MAETPKETPRQKDKPKYELMSSSVYEPGKPDRFWEYLKELGWVEEEVKGGRQGSGKLVWPGPKGTWPEPPQRVPVGWQPKRK